MWQDFCDWLAFQRSRVHFRFPAKLGIGIFFAFIILTTIATNSVCAPHCNQPGGDNGFSWICRR